MPATDKDKNGYGLVRLREPSLPDTAVTGGLNETIEARFADDALACACPSGTATRETKRGRGHSFEADADGLELLVFRAKSADDQGGLTDPGWPAS